MHKINVANYVIFDLANRLNFADDPDMDSQLVQLVADDWHKRHFVPVIKKVQTQESSFSNQRVII